MDYFSYPDSSYPIRNDIKQAYRDYWQRLASPGCWWTGAERLAIAAEVRAATRCQFCAQRKQALSPYNFNGQHEAATELHQLAVDAVHRIVTDQTRITRSWIDQLDLSGLSREAYVELAGIVVAVFSIDEFNRALGFGPEPLPPAQAGEPTAYRPPQAEQGVGFVPMIPVAGAVGNERPPERSANVLRALSLVPDAVRDWMQLSAAQYLSLAGMANMLKQDDRAIDRMQMELVAGRVSAINECFY